MTLTIIAPEKKHGRTRWTTCGGNWLTNVETDAWLRTLGTDFERGIPKMTRSEVLYERFRGTRFGWFLTHPLTVLITRLLGVTAFVLTLILFYAQGQESNHASQIARRESTRAVAQAQASERRAEAAQATAKASAAAAQAKASALAKQELCKLVSFNADTTTYPPTTQRGYQIAALWKEFGNSSVLRCGIK
jgi:hypothetical protein